MDSDKKGKSRPLRPIILDDYKITEISGGYYGFVRADGAWYIMWNNSGSWRYVKGASNFSTAWDGRLSLAYDYFDNVF